MAGGSIDVLTRRGSLMALGAASLTGLARSIAADAKKKRKNTKNSDANKRCKRQAGDWTILVTAECDSDPDCLVALACANSLRSCDFSSFLDCLLD